MTRNAPRTPPDDGGTSKPHPIPDSAWSRIADEQRERDQELAEASARPRHPRRRDTPEPFMARPPLRAAHDAAPAFSAEALDAHAAGVHDADEALSMPAYLVQAEREAQTEDVETDAAARMSADVDSRAADAPPEADQADTGQEAVEHGTADVAPAPDAKAVPAGRLAPAGTEPAAAEHDHDRRTRGRYQPPTAGGGPRPEVPAAARTEAAPEALQGEIVDAADPRVARTGLAAIVHAAAEHTGDAATGNVSDTGSVVPDTDEPTGSEPLGHESSGSDGGERRPGPEQRSADEPEIMILPEPNRARSGGEKNAVPGQPSGSARTMRTPSGTTASGDAQATERLISRERMENHPFWLTEQERAAAEASGALPARDGAPGTGRRERPGRRPREPRGPAGLVGLVVLGLVAAFFSWVSAEPFWLAVGHGVDGRATVAECVGSGVTQRCHGSFISADDRFVVTDVTLLGVPDGERAPGSVLDARMVSVDSRQVYVGGTGLLINLRWTLGFLLLLLCGYGIAGLTGARQLRTGRTRRSAVLMSLAGPILLLLGFLAATY
ncbi:hypothetical protein [Mangrovihabitans endophyticus]|uniref:Uncharacterized protein n=1 Tax=Mangrovihabitans endophyticus TaxID=1751298 RepID=A0A8J3BWB1_9ACTN|nr:hypothetical protein [Mangrovihabitans endophyticus]GGK83811.1 hypothetical protein GCM10012284_17410 [Mangrovihabitans endophyticus]